MILHDPDGPKCSHRSPCKREAEVHLTLEEEVRDVRKQNWSDIRRGVISKERQVASTSSQRQGNSLPYILQKASALLKPQPCETNLELLLPEL